ncbi:hypothetical protein PRIPAC_83711 [Pristionchus pacificus]|uniref:Uncharacterized protein n=1 Tax=Pristionchus pacificus TaxID=54126 RepID=A0A2A6BN23_PRIPA|nr:hypothetical protein PRIPAC_83711 [Pristionchus pacificus]|eukprot:PDM67317.1 hypothetical protein PRIPAC_48734 [Pristionchus pacificus]
MFQHRVLSLLCPFIGLAGSFVSMIAHEVMIKHDKQVFFGIVCINACLTSYGIIAMILAAHSYGEEEERKKKRDEDGEETGKGERVLAVLSVGALVSLWGCFGLAFKFKEMEVISVFVSALVSIFVFLTHIVLWGREENIKAGKVQGKEKAPMVVNNDNFVEDV